MICRTPHYLLARFPFSKRYGIDLMTSAIKNLKLYKTIFSRVVMTGIERTISCEAGCSTEYGQAEALNDSRSKILANAIEKGSC